MWYKLVFILFKFLLFIVLYEAVEHNWHLYKNPVKSNKCSFYCTLLYFSFDWMENNWPLSWLAVTRDKFLIIDSQQPGIDYTLLEELVSKSACDYEECVCIVRAEVKRWWRITQNTTGLWLFVWMFGHVSEREGYNHLSSYLSHCP